MTKIVIIILISGLFLHFIKKDEAMSVPQAQRISFIHNYHDQKIEDPYHWLRQKDWSQEKGVKDPAILDYLKAENAYTDNFFKDKNKTIDEIYTECVNLIDVDDQSYPLSNGEYSYFVKTIKGKDYPEHWRKNKKTNNDELILDENALSKGHEYFNLAYMEASFDHRYIAYATDTDGSERLTLKILDIEKKEHLNLELSQISGNGFVWLKDNSGFYYQKVDDNWRSNRVFFYDLKSETAAEKLIFEEKDTTNHVGISHSTDNQYLFINVKSAKDNIIYTQLLNTKKIDLQTPFPRKDKIIFSLDSQQNDWILSTNDKGPNKRLLRFSKATPLNHQHEINIFNKDYDQDMALISYSIYKNNIVILCKQNGTPILFVEDKKNLGQLINIPFDEQSFFLGFDGNDYHDDFCQLSLSSLTQPPSTLLLEFNSLSKKTVRVKSIPTYDQSQFETKRLFATSKDDVKVPYTIVYKKDITLGDAPVYLYGYGSYGYPLDPNFRTTFLPLLNRGFIVVLAHIRGGGDLGRSWYEAAKFKTKKKTFEDFIACAEHLIQEKYTTKGNIHICGGSAGGMLVGAVMNMRPELFKSVTAMVPFVDVINTMMDDSLPLTPGEFFEWGNPQQKDYFDYMMTYSPYDNVKAQHYPSIYITAGLNDPRVTYWEPAKWAAKLRYLKLDKNPLLLETEMGAGHGGPSGKFDYLKELAKRYAFLISCK